MYEPEVNDYVIWTNDLNNVHEGWVYFKCDPIDNKKRVESGWNEIPRYITIEIATKPKLHCEYSKKADRNHKLIHTLLLCYDTEWRNLKFIKRRRSKNDDTIILSNEYESPYSVYKSQEGRYCDVQ